MISKRRKNATLRKNQKKRSNRRLKKFQMRGGTTESPSSENIEQEVSDIRRQIYMNDEVKKEKILDLLRSNISNITPTNLETYGFTISDYIEYKMEKQQGSSPGEINKSELYINLREFGFTVKQIKEAKDNKNRNYFDIDSILKSYNYASSYNRHDFLDNDLIDLFKAGYTAKDLKSNGINFTPEMFVKANESEDLNPNEKKTGLLLLTDLKKVGFSATELKNSEFNLNILKKAGFSATELKGAGFTLDDLMRAESKFDLNELKTAEYNLIDYDLNTIFESGKYTYRQIKDMVESYKTDFTTNINKLNEDLTNTRLQFNLSNITIKKDGILAKLNDAEKKLKMFESSIKYCKKTGIFSSGFDDNCIYAYKKPL